MFHFNVMHREICVKGFSGTTALRILKFGANIAYDYLYHVGENQQICPFFSFSAIKVFVKDFSGTRILKF